MNIQINKTTIIQYFYISLIVLSVTLSYITMISYLIHYANQYRGIGTMSFYLPLVLFSFCPILLLTKKYGIMGVVFSLLLFLYFFSNGFFSTKSLEISEIQKYSYIYALFYISLFSYLCYFITLVGLVITGTIKANRNSGTSSRSIWATIFFIIYLFAIVVMILYVMVTKNSLMGALV